MTEPRDSETFTPVYCFACQMWVPEEREPHRSERHPDPHHAKDMATDPGIAVEPEEAS